MTTRKEQDETWAEVYGRLSLQERGVADDIATRAPDNARQDLQWAEELAALIEMLSDPMTKPIWPVVRMFWVRFHGVITEMLSLNRQPAEWARAMTPEERAQNLLQFPLAIFDAAKAMLDALAEEEIVVADYLRQRAVHLRQSAYSLRLTKRRDVVDSRSIDQVGKTFSVEEVDRMRLWVQKRHGSELEFARYVSGKVRAGAQQLLASLQELHSPELRRRFAGRTRRR